MEKKIDTSLKQKYNLLKIEFERELGEETLRKYKILSKAYKLGKKIYGYEFSVKVLSEDFDISYTTTKRILALNYASKFAWKQINDDKISAFKVAQICLKTKCYKDELIKMVIKDNLSTYDIKNINAESLDKINKSSENLAVEKKFTRQDSAFRSMSITLLKLRTLLIMPIVSYPKSKQKKILEDLELLKEAINKYIMENKHE